MNSPWPLIPLSEVLSPISRPERVDPEKSYNILGAHWYAEGLYIKDVLNGSEIRANQLYRVERGDFVYNRLFGWKGSFALATDENDGCYVSNEFPCFIVRSDRADGRYIWRYFSLPSVWEEVFSLSTGGTPTSRNRLKEAQLLGMRISLPLLEEQRRIVARIEEISAKIEEARALRQRTLEETNALLISGITHAFANISSDGYLGDFLLEKPRNGWSARCDNADGGVPVLSLSAVTRFRYRASEFKRTSEPTADDAHYWLHEGDLLITRSNTPELVGHAAIYTGSPQPCIYPDLMMRIELNEQLADKSFVHRWLMSAPVRDYIRISAKGTSPTMKKISQDTVMRIPFPSQISIGEQRRIVAYLDVLQAKVDSLKKLQEETAEDLDALMPSILSRAFSGTL